MTSRYVSVMSEVTVLCKIGLSHKMLPCLSCGMGPGHTLLDGETTDERSRMRRSDNREAHHLLIGACFLWLYGVTASRGDGHDAVCKLQQYMGTHLIMSTYVGSSSGMTIIIEDP